MSDHVPVEPPQASSLAYSEHTVNSEGTKNVAPQQQHFDTATHEGISQKTDAGSSNVGNVSNSSNSQNHRAAAVQINNTTPIPSRSLKTLVYRAVAFIDSKIQQIKLKMHWKRKSGKDNYIRTITVVYDHNGTENDRWVKAKVLVDTGSPINLISEYLACKLGFQPEKDNKTFTYESLGGRVSTIGTLKGARWALDDGSIIAGDYQLLDMMKLEPADFEVCSSGIFDVIIGRDTIEKVGMKRMLAAGSRLKPSDAKADKATREEAQKKREENAALKKADLEKGRP